MRTTVIAALAVALAAPAPAAADDSGVPQNCHAVILHAFRAGSSTAAAAGGGTNVQSLQKSIDLFCEAVET